jgi:hypothetical protein
VTEGLGDCTQLVDAVAMIGMVVSNDHGVDGGDLGFEKLLADIRATIDEEAASVALDQDR